MYELEAFFQVSDDGLIGIGEVSTLGIGKVEAAKLQPPRNTKPLAHKSAALEPGSIAFDSVGNVYISDGAYARYWNGTSFTSCTGCP